MTRQPSASGDAGAVASSAAVSSGALPSGASSSSQGPAQEDLNTESVARLQSALGRSARLLRETASGGLTPTQLAVLGALLREGPRQLTELSIAERINPTLLSRVVAKLEDEGFVLRSPHEQDRRAYLLSITDKGRSLAEGIRRDRCEALTERLTRIDPAHVDTLFGALTALEALAEELTVSQKD